MGGRELEFIRDAFSSNYIAPAGPQLEAFEHEFAEKVGARFAVAVSSGTAALHLLMRYLGIEAGDEVFCSTFTFVASANPILYQGGTPVFVDSDYSSWNMDPHLLEEELRLRKKRGRLPRALILVHLYGQAADISTIKSICEQYDIALIEDAAEALGASYQERVPGTFGLAGVFSFNGNKIITTSGGGMIVSDSEQLVDKVRFWSTQAREATVHYEHEELGYNYRMSNILAAIGRGQLQVLDDRVAVKREIFSRYRKELSDLPGVCLMPEPDYGRSTRWLSCLTIDKERAGFDRNRVIKKLEKQNIESRPLWKPMHMQPLYSRYQVVGGTVAESLFQTGICLPSGTEMTESDLNRIIKIIRSCWDD